MGDRVTFLGVMTIKRFVSDLRSLGLLAVSSHLVCFFLGYRGQPSTTARLTQDLFHLSSNRLLTVGIKGRKGGGVGGLSWQSGGKKASSSNAAGLFTSDFNGSTLDPFSVFRFFSFSLFSNLSLCRSPSSFSAFSFQWKSKAKRSGATGGQSVEGQLITDFSRKRPSTHGSTGTA